MVENESEAMTSHEGGCFAKSAGDVNIMIVLLSGSITAGFNSIPADWFAQVCLAVAANPFYTSLVLNIATDHKDYFALETINQRLITIIWRRGKIFAFNIPSTDQVFDSCKINYSNNANNCWKNYINYLFRANTLTVKKKSINRKKSLH